VVSRRGRSGGHVVTRGEVWLAVLDPTIGSEMQKTRPCLIVSPPEINDHLHTSIVAPMTTGGQLAPYRIPVNFRGRAGLIVLDQMRTIDEQRLVRRLGTIGVETLRTTLAALREMFEE
jgi:mRNA interferase MazF